MSILSWIVFGLIVGLVANLLEATPSKGGIIGSAILGIVGAVAGGFLGNALFGVGVTGFDLSSFIVALIGAMIVVTLHKGIVRKI